MQLWIGPLALTRAWNKKWNGIEILVWSMEDTVPEWNGRFQERNGRQSFLLPYQFCTGPQQLTTTN